MNITDRYQDIVEELEFLKEVKKKEFRYSNILLFREYQTRLFAWKTACGYNGIDSFNKSKNFHNIFIDISLNLSSQIIPEEKVINDLKSRGVDYVRFTFRDYDGFFICMYINWEIFKSEPEISSYPGLSNPYLPAFQIIARGGTIFNSELKFEIDNGQTFRRYDRLFHLPSLEEDFLMFIDDNSNDFPNQERVDFLWSRFERFNRNKI